MLLTDEEIKSLELEELKKKVEELREERLKMLNASTSKKVAKVNKDSTFIPGLKERVDNKLEKAKPAPFIL